MNKLEVSDLEDMDDKYLDIFLFKFVEIEIHKESGDKTTIGFCIDTFNTVGMKFITMLEVLNDGNEAMTEYPAYHNDWYHMIYNKDSGSKPPRWYIKHIYVYDDSELLNIYKSHILELIFSGKIFADIKW